jgi:hypothetical protein
MMQQRNLRLRFLPRQCSGSRCRASRIQAASAPECARSCWRHSLQASATDLGPASTLVAIGRLMRDRCRGWSCGRPPPDWGSYWDERPQPERPFQFCIRDCLWSQGLLSPRQLVPKVLGLPPKFNLDLLLGSRGQGLDGPLGGFCSCCVPLDLVEETGEESCLCLD